MKLLNVDTIEQVKEKLEIYFGQAEHGGNVSTEPNLPIEDISILQAVGRFLGEDICSNEPVPGFHRSVVDGYAVKAKNTFGVSDSVPVFLKVAGRVEMGETMAEAEVLQEGQAIYVPTGGELPVGADAMVMVEYVEHLDEKTIAVYKATAPGDGVMHRGDDFEAGKLVYKRGHRVTAKDVGMLAALGRGFLQVFAKPEVFIISTGDELISIFETPGPGQIRDINSHSLSALVEKSGGIVKGIFLARDDREALTDAIRHGLEKANIVLISGGSSAGDKDMTAQIIDSLGEPGVITHGIAMKPGKPTIVGVLKNPRCCCNSAPQLVVGLPGHPMAAIMAYETVVDYYIKKYCFSAEQTRLSTVAQITENLRGGDGRETFVMVALRRNEEGNGWLAEPIHAKSGSISQLRYGDGYVRIGHLSEGIHNGQIVEVEIFS